MTYIIAIENEDHWHGLRSQYIGASESPALFSLSPHTTPFSLYCDKAGIYKGKEVNALMEFGNDMEPLVAKWLARQTGWEIMKGNEYHVHPEHRLGCTLDYYVLDSENGPGLLEIKNVHEFAPDWSQTKAPDHIEMQLQHQLFVVNAARIYHGYTPFSWGAIGSMHGCNPEDIRVFPRQADLELHQKIADRAKQFWQDVEQGNAPDMVDAKDYGLVSDLFKHHETEIVRTWLDLTDEEMFDSLVSVYQYQKQIANEATKAADDAKTKLLYRMAAIKRDGVICNALARTENFELEAKIINVNYQAKPASTGQQLRFNVKHVNKTK